MINFKLNDETRCDASKLIYNNSQKEQHHKSIERIRLSKERKQIEPKETNISKMRKSYHNCRRLVARSLLLISLCLIMTSSPIHGLQQHQHQAATMMAPTATASQISSSSSSSSLASITTNSTPSMASSLLLGNQQKPGANINQGGASNLHEPSPAMNLIPVDQPMPSTRAKQMDSEPSQQVAEISSSEQQRFRQDDSIQQVDQVDNVSTLDEELEQQQQVMEQQQVSNEPLLQSQQPPVDVKGGSPFEQQQQQQQQQVGEFINGNGATKYPHQQQPIVERRFGLFKNKGGGGGGGHYGAPMGANYAAGPYMSDCERCLAGLGGGPSADLQQIDPIPVPVQPVMPAPHVPVFNSQPFGPLKNKLFMKFPFFVKPGVDFGNFMSSGGGNHYWPPAPAPPPPPPTTHYQPAPRPLPAMTNALYLRPGPAYNCIQANPPLLAAASTPSQDITTLTGGKTSGTKQAAYPHQQATYSSSQY